MFLCACARARACRQSCGTFLCFLDSDDIMDPRRIERQLAAALDSSSPSSSSNSSSPSSPPQTTTKTTKLAPAIIGCNFTRFPSDSTPRYTQWLNSLNDEQLYTHALRELTLIQPTWFFHRSVFDSVDGYDDTPDAPEDLIFFYRHLQLGGRLLKVRGEPLLRYRYSSGSLSWRVSRITLLRVRVRHFVQAVASARADWKAFSIWGAGRGVYSSGGACCFPVVSCRLLAVHYYPNHLTCRLHSLARGCMLSHTKRFR